MCSFFLHVKTYCSKCAICIACSALYRIHTTCRCVCMCWYRTHISDLSVYVHTHIEIAIIYDGQMFPLSLVGLRYFSNHQKSIPFVVQSERSEASWQLASCRNGLPVPVNLSGSSPRIIGSHKGNTWFLFEYWCVFFVWNMFFLFGIRHIFEPVWLSGFLFVYVGD